MDQKEQQVAFSNELESLIDRFRSEYDLTYASIVGVLQITAYLLCRESEDN